MKPVSAPKPLTVFWLDRVEDVSGVSGRVAQGVVFADGTTVLRWLTEHRSTAVYESVAEMEAIHGHGGATVTWESRETPPEPDLDLERLARALYAASNSAAFYGPNLADAPLSHRIETKKYAEQIAREYSRPPSRERPRTGR